MLRAGLYARVSTNDQRTSSHAEWSHGGPARAIFAQFEREIPHERTKAWLGPCTSERNETGAAGLPLQADAKRVAS
jgi:hypothetical protein